MKVRAADNRGDLSTMNIARPKHSWYGSRVVYPLIALAVILGCWQLATLVLSPLLISSPVRVLQALSSLLSSGTLITNMLFSLREMAIGGSIGLMLGFVLGVLMAEVGAVDAVCTPFVNFINATPLIVVIPLLVIWVGITVKARILLIVLISIWPVLLNTRAGLRNVRRDYLDVGSMFGHRGVSLLLNIRLPAATPYILAGVRNGLGLALIGMVVSEMEVSYAGVGYLLIFFGEQFRMSPLFGLLIVASAFGIVNVTLLKIVQRLWFPWIGRA